METDPQPALAFRVPPPKPYRPGARIIPVPLLVAWVLTIPLGAIGLWIGESYAEDPGWWVVVAAFLAFLGCGIATAVRLAEARRRGRPVQGSLAAVFGVALLLLLVGMWTPLGWSTVGGVALLLSGATCLGVAFAIVLLDARAQPELRAKTVEVAELRASRGRLVDASDAARREIERDLHDGVQPRLVALLLNLSMARRAGQFDGAPAVIDEIENELRGVLRDIRDLASGILPPALTDLGLEAAVTELTGRLPFRVELSVPTDRLPDRAEVTAYFVIAEALTNAAKHAGPSKVAVRVTVQGARVMVEVQDDGRGGANAAGGTGLLGLADRVDTLEGRLTVASPNGGGTTVRAEFSCAS